MPNGQTVSFQQVIRQTLRGPSTYCCGVASIKDASDQARSPTVASELDSQEVRVRAESQDSIKATSPVARKMLSTASLKLQHLPITTPRTTIAKATIIPLVPPLQYKNTHLSRLIMWSRLPKTVQVVLQYSNSKAVRRKNNKAHEL